MYLRYGDISWNSPATAEQTAPQSAMLATATESRRGQDPPPGEPRKLPVIRLNGIQVHAVTEEACIRHILGALSNGRGGVVVTPNLDHLRRCAHDIRFSALVAEADLVIADGMPLVWASRLQGTPLPKRIAGSDLISSLSAAAAEHDRSIFLLGGTPASAEAAANILAQRHPNLKIAGTHCPPFGFENNGNALEIISQILHNANPDIVYVALGSPKQELLIERIRPTLPNAWWLGVGNSFSFLSGHIPRAPLWMQRHGLEWLHRLLQEPRRLFKRYIVLGLPFGVSLLSRSILQGLPGRVRARWIKHHPQPRLPAKPISAITRPSESSPPAPARMTAIHRRHPLSRLRSIVLLGGSLRPTQLTTLTQRSVLDLPLDDNGSILNHWLNHASDVARLAELDSLPLRIVVDRHSPQPRIEPSRYDHGIIHLHRDHTEFRGSGGVLADLADNWSDDDLILVLNARQIPLEPLASLTQALHCAGGDVSLVAHRDGTPSGVMLLACQTLRCIPPTGFVDMKEQALPQIANRFDVTVVNRRRPTGLPIRSLNDYIAALRRFHQDRLNRQTPGDPFAEDWQPAFAIVEAGATIDVTARLHDSVVLRGGCVQAGAVVVRSVIAPGGVARSDQPIVDQLIGAEETRRKR